MTFVSVEDSVVLRFDDFSLKISNIDDRILLYADSTFYSELRSRIESVPLFDDDILSLDVFDTLLIRDGSSELTRFIEIGARMADLIDGTKKTKAKSSRRKLSDIPSQAAIDAFLARHLGTKASYRARSRVNGCREGSLSEIHRIASLLLTGRSDYQDTFVEAELDYEATRLKSNKALLDVVEWHRGRGGRTVLVTDMYMHADQVRALLARLGIDPNIFDHIISSADTLESKASGGIFRIVEERMGVSSDKFVHIGDNLEGDFRQPRRKGWRSLHLPVSDAELARRVQDHQRSVDLLRDRFSLTVDVAAPH